MECDDVYYVWPHTKKPATVQAAIASGDHTALQAISYHNICNAFWSIQNGGNPRNIHGMTPGELLHAVELGLMKYGIRGFAITCGLNPNNDKSPLLLLQIMECYAKGIG